MNQENINNTRYFSQLYSSPFQGPSTRDHSSYWVTGVRRHKELNPQPCSLGRTWSCFLGEIWSDSSFIAEILDSDFIQLSGFFSHLWHWEKSFFYYRVEGAHTQNILLLFFRKCILLILSLLQLTEITFLNGATQALWVPTPGSLRDILKPIFSTLSLDKWP